MRRSNTKLFKLLSILSLLGFGVYINFWAYSQHSLSKQSGKWPSVPGEILESEIHVTQVKGSKSYCPIVYYSYKFSDKIYNSDRIAFGQNALNHLNDAQVKIAKYPVGKKISVYVNPQSPDMSCLEPREFNQETYWAFAAGAFLVLSSLFFTYVYYFVW